MTDTDTNSFPVLDVPAVVELEQAIAASGTSLATLMARAGAAIAQEVSASLTSVDGDDSRGTVVVLAGSGNNGGDGWVAARLLAEGGHEVTLITPKSAEELKAEPARDTALAVEALDLPLLSIMVDPSEEALDHALRDADVIIDALLGTGFSGQSVRAPMGNWITLLNDVKQERTAEHSGAPRPLTVIAADVPSGLSAQTGQVADPCVKADKTVTMLVLKPGLLSDSATAWVGELHTADLGVDVSQYL